MNPLARQLLHDRPVAYHPMLAKAVGGATTGLFLSQLLYWSGKGAALDGWIWKTQADWETETGLTRYEQETARKHLKHQGVLEEQLAGLPAKLYYRVNFDALETALVLQTSMGENPKQERGKRPYLKGGKPQTINRESESTTESTTESIERESKISQNSQNQEISENPVPLRKDSEEPDDDQTLWPTWYANGYAVPGWKVPLKQAEAWLVKADIPKELAEVKSYGLRDWWERLPEDSARRWKGDPWLTFQNWCRRDRDGWIKNNGGRDGKSGTDTETDWVALAAEVAERNAVTEVRLREEREAREAKLPQVPG